MPTSSRQDVLFCGNPRRIRNFYWVDVGIDPYKCGLLEVRPFLLRSLYRLRKRNAPSKKGQRLEAQARQRNKIVPAAFSSISFLPRQKRYGPRSAGDGAVYRIAPPVHTKHAAEGRFQCGKTEMKTRTVRCEKILPSLPAEGRGTRVSRILRGATQVQRAAPSLCPR